MLVVIVVIALLAGLLIPMVMKSRTAARATRMAMDMQTIATGLEAYKMDFGDYPRPQVLPATGMAPAVYGSQLLCWALVGPGDDSATANGDGAVGLGFRVRRGSGGKVYGPYIPAEKYKLKPFNGSANPLDSEIQDTNGNRPIYYLPAKHGANQVDLNTPNSYVWGGNAALFNKDFIYLPATAEEPPRPKLEDLQKLLDADPATGKAKDPNTAFKGPYLLWSPGPDGEWGTGDDVSNKQ